MAGRTTIPLVDLKQEYAFLQHALRKAIAAGLHEQQWILGKKVILFEEALARFSGVKRAAGVASGTDALLLSLRALALSRFKKPYFDRRDEIITTPFTFAATAETVVRSGATPVFVDIEPETFNIDPTCIRKAITKNTVGIIPVHLFGLACAMKQICRLAADHGLFIVEDCAQALGAQVFGRKTGSFGDCGAFSFFPSKNLGAYGDAGGIITNSPRLERVLKVLRDHGQRKAYDAVYIGYNSRLDTLQAAILLVKMKYLEEFNARRRKAAAAYAAGLCGIAGLAVPAEPEHYQHAWGVYTLRVLRHRDRLLEFLKEQGVGARIYYPKLLSDMEAFRGAMCRGTLSAARMVSRQVISLPMHPFLTAETIRYITEHIRRFFG